MEGRNAVSASPIPKRQFMVEPCSLAHDLINDVAIIMGECDLLADSMTDRVGAERLGVIRTAARRMADRIAHRPCPVKVEIVATR